jgi:membrane protease subunit HflK
MRATFLFGAILVALLIWLGTGFYTVDPDEQALVRQFGRVTGVSQQGLHWRPPTPIARHDTVKVTQVRRMEVGFRSEPVVRTDPVEALMITGDENIVDVQLLVQFEIKDIEKFLFRAVDPARKTIKDATESALRQVVGARGIDDVLTTEKEAVQAETKDLLQELLDTYEAGIRVAEVKLNNVNPPAEVQDAFDDVVRAREDKERIINLAAAYEEDILPRARGDAERLKQEAEAFRAQRVNEATGQAERFISILEAYRKAPDITAQRLYLERMETTLAEVEIFIVDGEVGGNLLQLLNLNEVSQTPFAPQAPAPVGPSTTIQQTDSTSQ